MESTADPLQNEPLAYLNGEFLPLRHAKLPVWDLGIVQGATVTEAVRTFRHEPFRLDDHLRRLEASLRGLGLQPRESREQLRHLTDQLSRFNAAALDVGSDLLINLFVTAGESRLHSGGFAVNPGRPTVCITTRPLEFRSAARQYRDGLSLVIPSVRHIPPSSIDPRIKYRSRLHWYLADQEVQRLDPAAEALLLDLEGFVTETSRGNIFARFGDRLKTPSESTTLAGVSQQIVIDLLSAKNLRVERSDMSPDDLQAADEILLSSTSACLVPVTRLNGRLIGDGKPGPLWKDLLDDWSRLVGADILAQAASHALNPES